MMGSDGILLNQSGQLSDQIAHLWGKASNDPQSGLWTPLYIHLLDTARVGTYLWNHWISDNIKKRISNGIKNTNSHVEPEKLVSFVCLSHDIGKAIPPFQSRNIPNNQHLSDFFRSKLQDMGLHYRSDLNEPNAIPHPYASEIILERNGIPRCIADVAGGHHGTPPNKKQLRTLAEAYPDNMGRGEWSSVQDDLVSFCMDASGLDPKSIRDTVIDASCQVLLTSIVVIADWITSNSDIFPLSFEDDKPVMELEERATRALNNAVFPPVWKPELEDEDVPSLFKNRFSYDPRPFQSAIADVASRISAPGIMIVEAPMGEGKTEAALVAAEILAKRFGMGGLMIALPTQATSDGIFPRVKKWIDVISESQTAGLTMFLAHGKSRFNTDYTALEHVGFSSNGSKEGGIIHEWFTGKRKGILSDFVIGTVDQALMMGLKQKHLEMRHFGLAGKVVIIDEVHAYDAYMGSYLSKTLEWLGTYKTPVILLSATLPPIRRAELLAAYMGSKGVDERVIEARSYPLITFSNESELILETPPASGRKNIVEVKRITDADISEILQGAISNGGYFGIILNTVKRAQNMAATLRSEFPTADVRLLHSGFTSIDRSNRESEVLNALGPGRKVHDRSPMIVVGTQVMEQSMDLDFDLLLTDLCPIDLLLQRIGRLHRHENRRPNGLETAKCYVIDTGEEPFDKGAETVYGKYQLYNTRLLLQDSIKLPDDIPKLVSAAYSCEMNVPESILNAYAEAKTEQDTVMKNKRVRAQAFQISRPGDIRDLIGWIDCPIIDDSQGNKAQATVRDGDRSVEVTMVMKTEDDLILPLPGTDIPEGTVLPSDKAPDAKTAFTIAGCKVPLPRLITKRIGIDKTIDIISAMNHDMVPKAWKESEWLNGELILMLDESMRADVAGFTIAYDYEQGMRIVD